MEPLQSDVCGYSLLYVEDEADARDMLSSIIAKKYPEMKIFVAENGATGLELFRDQRPGIVLTDMNMPVMNGIQMAREIKALDAETVIIAVTAFNEPDYLRNAIEIGIRHYVLKPVISENIFEVINKTIEEINLKRLAREQDRQIRKREQQLAMAQKITHLGSWEWDMTSGKTSWSDELYRIFGIEPASIPASYKEFLERVHPEDRATVKRDVLNALKKRQAIISHYCRIIRPDGSIRTIRGQGELILDGAGKLVSVIGTSHDVTELLLARQEMLKTQKIESLGILAGGIAHDFNNLLVAILGNISLARLQILSPEKAVQRLQDAEKATDRAKDLAKQLLTFARGGDPVKKIIDVRSILKEAAGFALLGSNVTCALSIANDLWPVEADEGQIVQVIHNLVLNAVHAMPQGGTVTVSAENVSARQSDKKFVRFSVADTGTGISEQHLLKIFDPYFTTKQHGSGLGLATCYSIIRKHGGKIRATSLLGKGSTFTISLPASVQKRVFEPDTRIALFRGSGRVLVMDDQEIIRDIAQSLLEHLGYMVECAENGSEAVDLYLKSKEMGKPFAAVILDLTVPGGVGGRETIAKLLEINPYVKAIVCSGYSDDPVMANYREYGFRGVLNKPFRLDELSNAMYDLLK